MLPKRWSKELEDPIVEEWKKSNRYAFVPDGRTVFSIDTPPPYVNTPIHLGHAFTYALMDMFARYRRMKGFNVLFPLGLDRNGLPIEVAAERKFSVSLHDVSREKFLGFCEKILQETSTESIDSFLKLGISFSSWKLGTGIGDIYYTDSEDYRAMSQATFIDLWNKDLIYEDSRVNNYCPGCRTTIADAEIEYDERETIFNDIKFRVKETGEDVIIATTRPELLPACGMVIFNPEDDRYASLEDKTAVVPLFEKEVPIKAHPMAEIDKGTGLMMMCSFGDQTDIRFFREQKLDPVILIEEDGKMNEKADFLKDLTIKEAQQKVVEELKKKNLIVKQKKVMHRTPICERSKDAIEFIELPELYVKQVEFKDDMKKIAQKINVFDEKSRQILLDWIDSVTIDWPVSRHRYYATEIPLWYCSCGKIILGERGKYVRPWKEKPPKGCPECGGHDIRGEERVFDTWFDSSSSPQYILKWLDYPDQFEKYVPCSLRPQGKEIVRTWLYYTLLKTFLDRGEPIFKDVWIHHHIVDESGRKMSKSLGNMIDPHDIIEKFGAEPFRLWCAVEGNLSTTDLRCSFDRIDGAGKTLTKLWNVTRFLQNLGPLKQEKAELMETDKWIIHEINTLIKYADERYEKYDFHNPVIKIKHFLWETFASHYVELVKSRAYNNEAKFSEAEQNGALFTLRYCLENLMKLLAPVIPIMTEILYKEIYERDLHSEKFPKVMQDHSTAITKEDVEELNSTVWRLKKANSLSLKTEIAKLTLPEKFRAMEKDIREMHRAADIDYGNAIEVKIK